MSESIQIRDGFVAYGWIYVCTLRRLRQTKRRSSRQKSWMHSSSSYWCTLPRRSLEESTPKGAEYICFFLATLWHSHGILPFRARHIRGRCLHTFNTAVICSITSPSYMRRASHIIESFFREETTRNLFSRGQITGLNACRNGNITDVCWKPLDHPSSLRTTCGLSRRCMWEWFP